MLLKLSACIKMIKLYPNKNTANSGMVIIAAKILNLRDWRSIVGTPLTVIPWIMG